MVLKSAPLHLTSAADNNNSIIPRNAGSAAAASTAHSIPGSSLPGDTAGADAAAGQRQDFDWPPVQESGRYGERERDARIGHRRPLAPGDGQLRDSVARHGMASRGSAYLSHRDGRSPGPQPGRPPAALI